jgi:glycosyltransferase involved in cell wall biosynthesis
MRDLWIVVPAYNEAEVLAATLDQLHGVAGSVVVIDDGSTDQTAALAKAKGVLVVRHAINLGQGAALSTGLAFAVARGATHVCTFDADGQHDPRTIAELCDAVDECGADVGLASRFLGGAVAMSWMRKQVLRLAIVFTRLHTGLRITDTHNGLRLFTRSAARRIEIRQPQMAHGSEILSQIAKLRLRYVEVPTVVTYTVYSRRKGQSLFDSVRIVFDLACESLSR